MSGVLVDSNVLIDILTEDPDWVAWSETSLAAAANRSRLIINQVIYAEVSVRFDRLEDVDYALSPNRLDREQLPFEAAFLAGKAFNTYRLRGGAKRSPLPDFFIGAHAAVSHYALLTRDAARYRTYFPQLKLIAPDER